MSAVKMWWPERLISSAIVPVSLQATQADVARAYNRSITHPAHLLSEKQCLLRACSYFTSVQSRVKLRTPRFLIPRGRKRLAGGSRPPSTGERRGDQILSPSLQTALRPSLRPGVLFPLRCKKRFLRQASLRKGKTCPDSSFFFFFFLFACERS